MKKILFLLPLFLLLSCNKTTVFTKTYKDFDDNRWQKTDVKVFDFDLKKEVASGDIEIKFSHVFDPQYASVPFEVMINYPDGKTENVYLNLQLKDGEDNVMSECAGDVCDFTMNIKEEVPLPAGQYKITLENKFDNDYIPNVLAVSLSVKKDD